MRKSIHEIRKQLEELNERQKELRCLYNINTILRNEQLSSDEIMLRITEEIPGGYRFPDKCKSMICINGNEIASPGSIITEFRQSSTIKIQDEVIGEVIVYYTGAVPLFEGKIFLDEEQKLIDTIGESIGHFLTIRHLLEITSESQGPGSHQKDYPGFEKWLSAFKINKEQTAKLLTTRIHFRKGELILKQGAIASYMVLITEGIAKAYVEDLNKRNLTIRIIKPFEFIGLSSLSGGGTNGFAVSAIVPSSGYLISKEVFQSITEENPRFNLRILSWYAKKSELLYHRLNIIGNKQAPGRLADALLYLWEEVFDHKVIDPCITRKIIAELGGMSVENGVRILSELKSEGIISTGKEGIEIFKPEKLRTLIMVS